MAEEAAATDAALRRADESVSLKFTRLMKATTSPYGSLTDPPIVEKLATLGIVATPGPPQQLADQIATDLPKYGQVVKAAGIKAE